MDLVLDAAYIARMTAAIETRALRKEYPAPTPRRRLGERACASRWRLLVWGKRTFMRKALG